MSHLSWHKHGQAAIPATKQIGFAQAMPPEVKPKPKQPAYSIDPGLGLKQDPYA